MYGMAAGPQLLGQGFPSACQMSLLIGRARAGNLPRHDRSGDGTLRRPGLSKGIPSSPYPTGGVSGQAKKFQAPAWEASALD